eukprot:jgi/Astpho2/7917/gw1.00118.65.1_t
MDATARPSGVV